MKKKKKKTVKKSKKSPVKKAVKKPEAKTHSAPVKRERPAAEPVTDTDDFKLQLELLRDDLMATVRKKKEEVVLPEAEVGDEADVAVRSLERDLSFEQGGTELHLLDEVEAALRRIDKKIYGICEANGERIKDARLKAMPYARYCLNCQARFEHI